MSDAATQSLRISREGIVLIKSFEGFRPRAISREDGGWIIGYGHTLSAREGATVSEADAELLLRYDLLPVEKSVNETAAPPLNQHQFDALVSFAFSVGLERFVTSDVRQRLMAGAAAEAADAMIGWPEPPLRAAALRRRAAERALFVADPAGPVSLSDLLAAPLPVEARPVPAPPVDGSPEPTQPGRDDTDTPLDTRHAAVAALLGELPTLNIGEAVSATEASGGPVSEAPQVSAEGINAPPELAGSQDTGLPDTPDAAIGAEPEAVPDPVEWQNTQSKEEPDPQLPAAKPAPQAVDPVGMSVARYAPYSAAMVGPLPYLKPASPRVASPQPPEPVEEASTAAAGTPDANAAPPVACDTGDSAEPGDAVSTTPPERVEPEPEPVEITQPDTAAPGTVVADVSFAPLVPDASPKTDPAIGLVLTPLEDTAEPAVIRPLWTPEQRALPESLPETGLFGEELGLAHGGGAVLRHENETAGPARFDWSETGAFVIMGAVGLTSFGAAMAAFRLASEQSNGGTETAMIAWVLAIIGAACVGVSSFNLYRRWGLPGGD